MRDLIDDKISRVDQKQHNNGRRTVKIANDLPDPSMANSEERNQSSRLLRSSYLESQESAVMDSLTVPDIQQQQQQQQTTTTNEAYRHIFRRNESTNSYFENLYSFFNQQKDVYEDPGHDGI